MQFIKKTNGSVLVWTIALGMIMTSVFLFMALRLNRGMTLRRASLEFFQEEAYLQSYVDYVAQLEPEEWEVIKQLESGTEYDGITGTLSNEVAEIKGFLDHNQSVTFPIDGQLFVKWNQCIQGILKEEGEIESDPDFSGTFDPACGAQGYEDAKYDRTAVVDGSGTFTLTSTGEPMHYTIISNVPFAGNEWALNVQKKLQTGRVIQAEERWGM